MDRIDEAVSVAYQVLMHALVNGSDNREALRLAFLAGMKVLLGPVVGHSSFSHQVGNRHYIGMSPVLISSAIETGTPLYAPSLGEGE